MRIWSIAIFGVACSADPVDTGDTVEIDPLCEDAQLVTYNNFGKSFITHSCQGCHSSDAINRFNAPEDVTFDDLDQVWDQAAVILAVAGSDTPTMPPQGGVSEDDRTKLFWWLGCGEVGR